MKTVEGSKCFQSGNHKSCVMSSDVVGSIIMLEDERYYCIQNYDKMLPFLINVVSDTDLWLFLSSNGGITAGRKTPDNALFPYVTDDKIYDSADHTGSVTTIFVVRGYQTFRWEPFTRCGEGLFTIQRSLYKNITGNKVIFEEKNLDLGLIFQSSWTHCNQFGIVRKSHIINENSNEIHLEILDGIRNILPAGTDRITQNELSTLIDGYKKNELNQPTGLALYTMSSLLTDKAEPAESLKATSVWSAGLEIDQILLSTAQYENFRMHKPLSTENETKGLRGAYLLHSNVDLSPCTTKTWYILADVNKDQVDIAALLDFLANEKNKTLLIERELKTGTENLNRKIASSDGFQMTGDENNVFRHASVTLFNILRGGLFEDNYQIEKADFCDYLEKANKKVLQSCKDFISELPDIFSQDMLIKNTLRGDEDLKRLAYEYLPLSFSRRHGDPSRPWNTFNIQIQNEQGKKQRSYEGNWRDIFQNWEALALSFPNYIESMIFRFVNASTADGYNPYRLTRDGFEWEIPDPNAPWSNIGYWGDHQIVYLLRLLRLSHTFHPEKLGGYLNQEIFVFANIPYRIRTYKDIVSDPHHTIEFDKDLNDYLSGLVKNIGSDGMLLRDREGKIIRVTLGEKLLIPLLVKLSNFIPEAGIWMNTQRPEWNDANNALVGFGASMVTVYHMRSYVEFLLEFLSEIKEAELLLKKNTFDLFNSISQIFKHHESQLLKPFSNQLRRSIYDELGQAGSDHRQYIYKEGINDKSHFLSVSVLSGFLSIVLKFIDHSIRSNRRNDNLYHSYNIISFSDRQSVTIRRLDVMLEGQVALLNSGYLSITESLNLLDALKRSSLYRKDQMSYILYPIRQLPSFLEKNRIHEDDMASSSLIKQWLESHDGSIVQKDIHGTIRFNSCFHNGRVLRETLLKLKPDNPQWSDQDVQQVCDIYEKVFDHQSFTGRSGTFYKYEGLGSIYWHMVLKLLLAVKETFFRAVSEKAERWILEQLKEHYYDIRKGIGSHKNPKEYGAFPTDPYSHTPENLGVQQPGMTGLTKEEILSRFGELGLHIRDGKICFSPELLNSEEFLQRSVLFQYYNLKGESRSLLLEKGMMANTYCQVPVIFIQSDENKIIITKTDGNEVEQKGLEINVEISRSLFNRDNSIEKIQVLYRFIDNADAINN